MIETLKSNLSELRERIDAAARRSGRTGSDVTLIGVSKYVDAEKTRLLFEAGCVDLGESRPQQLWEKSESLSDVSVRWHMIGHLQRNKVKRTIERTHLIHSVDSERLLTAIDNAAIDVGKEVDLLLEINVSLEEAKHGLTAADLPMMLEFAGGLTNVKVKGLMCMAGLLGNDSDAKREFASLRELRDRLKESCPDNVRLQELSMGMSGDFESAIEEGATMVRVGSLLFQGI